MMGAFAEFERSMIRERVLAGMSRAAASGTRSGKPIGRPRIEPETEAGIRAALQKGDMGLWGGDRDGTAGCAANRGFNGLKFSDLTDLAPRSIISDGGTGV